MSSILSLVGPLFIGLIIDEHILKLDIEGTIRMVLILAAIYIISAIFTWLQTYVMIRVSQKTIQQLRQHLLRSSNHCRYQFLISDNRVI